MALILWADMCSGNTQDWLKLSNSGDVLKLLILSSVWKYTSGWSNYSGKVIIQKMSENEMDYRGSKSIINNLMLANKYNNIINILNN